MAKKYDVFISYSRRDTEVAEEICTAFDEAGITYFIDRKGIGGGLDFPQVLAEAIEESRIFLFLGSQNSYASKFTNNEVLYAFNRGDISMLPYLIDDTPLPAKHEFTFANINIRNRKDHGVKEVLVPDVKALLAGDAERLAATGRKSSSRSKRVGRWLWPVVAVVLLGGVALAIALTSGGRQADPKAEPDLTDAKVQYEIGQRYLAGDGVPLNADSALYWFELSAAQGYAAAQAKMGWCYYNGFTVETDYAKAAEYYRKAAVQGLAEAQCVLGVCYFNGEGVEQDAGQAIVWYTRAAERGYDVAQYYLGVCYEFGQGVTADRAAARSWYQLSAAQGNADAQARLAAM